VTALGGTRKSGGNGTGQAAAGIGAGRPEIDKDGDGSVVPGKNRTSGSVSILGGEVVAKAGLTATNTAYSFPDPAQAIGVNVKDAGYNETNNAGWLKLDGVAVYTSADAAEPVPAAERWAACGGTNVWTRPCGHWWGEGVTCAWCGKGQGTAEDPYVIGNYAALVAFAGKLEEGQTSACGVLTADIVAEGTEWVPIGNNGVYFGTFDGGGHAIRGLSNEGVAEVPLYAGLFFSLDSGAVVRDVRLEDVSIKGKSGAGGVAGIIAGGAVSNCCVSGSVSGTWAGGVAGLIQHGRVANCWASGSVSGEWAGGITGLDQMSGQVVNCHAVCEVSGDVYGGGVVGRLGSDGAVANSYCLEGLGWVGWNDGGTVSECGELTAEQFRDAGNFKGWDFENVWMMGPDKPFLRVFGEPLELTVESAHGTAVPSAGAHGYCRGDTVKARVEGSPVSLGEGVVAACTGWELEGNEPGSGTGTEASFTLTNSAVLRWTWETRSLATQVTLGARRWQVVSIPFKNPDSEDGTFDFNETEFASRLPQGSMVLFWDAERQGWKGGMKSAKGWQGVNDHVLESGEAFCVWNSGGEEETVPVQGDVPLEAELSRSYGGDGSWTIMAPMYPISVEFGETELACQLPEWSTALFWDAGAQEWRGGSKGMRGWEAAVANHVLYPGEGFFIQTRDPGTWVQVKPGELP